MAEPESIRVFYRGARGVQRTNFNWSRLTKNSAVLVTAAECHFTPGLHVDTGNPSGCLRLQYPSRYRVPYGSVFAGELH